MIEAKGLTFAYGKRRPLVLNGLDLSIAPGEILALLGPNGIGKSTAISILSGLRKPQGGEVLIEGENLYEMKPSERGKKIGLVEQFPEFDSLTVFESVLLGRLPNFLVAPQQKDKESARIMIETIGLSDSSFRPVNELSGGERQLVAIGRALVNDPKFLLLDEPTSNLDIGNKLSVMRLIKKAAKEKGVAVLISLHDLNEALEIADRFAFISEGKIEKTYDKETLNEDIISSVYGVHVELIKDNDQLSIRLKERI